MTTPPASSPPPASGAPEGAGAQPPSQSAPTQAQSGPSGPPHAGAPAARRFGHGPRPGGPGARPGPGGRFRRPMARRKVCRFCAEKVVEIDYKATPVLRSFLTPRGKIISGRTTGNCAKHQRQLTIAIKRSQNIALLPFVGE